MNENKENVIAVHCKGGKGKKRITESYVTRMCTYHVFHIRIIISTQHHTDVYISCLSYTYYNINSTPHGCVHIFVDHIRSYLWQNFFHMKEDENLNGRYERGRGGGECCFVVGEQIDLLYYKYITTPLTNTTCHTPINNATRPTPVYSGLFQG